MPGGEARHSWSSVNSQNDMTCHNCFHAPGTFAGLARMRLVIVVRPQIKADMPQKASKCCAVTRQDRVNYAGEWFVEAHAQQGGPLNASL